MGEVVHFNFAEVVQDNDDGTLTVPAELFDSVLDDALFLEKLFEQGVENWHGFQMALAMHERELQQMDS